MHWVAWAILAAVLAAATAVLTKIGLGSVAAPLANAMRTSVALAFAWGVAAAVVPRAGWQ